eukprot:5950075-Lingulodinium_polyedra.AAC.1
MRAQSALLCWERQELVKLDGNIGSWQLLEKDGWNCITHGSQSVWCNALLTKKLYKLVDEQAGEK